MLVHPEITPPDNFYHFRDTTIILGGALVDLAERDSNAAAMIERLVRNLPREQDRKAFDGWDAKAASASPAPAPAPGSDSTA